MKIEPGPATGLEICALAVITAAALILRLPAINRSLTYDEIYTTVHFIDTGSLWETLSSYLVFNNHIAYSILARFSREIFGRSEWVLRLPALLMGVFSIYYLWIFGRRLLGPSTAIGAALVLALSPAHVTWSVSARGYTGMILFSLVAVDFYFQMLESPSRGRAAVFILAGTAAIYFHLYAAWVTVVQGVYLFYLLLSRRHSFAAGALRTALFSLVAVSGLSLILYSPVVAKLISNIAERGQKGFDPGFPAEVIKMFAGSSSRVFTAVLAVLGVAGFARLWKSFRPASEFILTLFFLPLVTMCFFRPFDLYPRFFVFCLPYFVLLVVYGTAGVRQCWDRCPGKYCRFSLSVLCAVAAGIGLATWTANSWNDIPVSGYREAVQAMEKGLKSRTILCAIGGGASLCRYYSNRIIYVPSSFQEFQRMIQRNLGVVCAYRKTSWDRPEHRKIADFLARNATAREFREITVYEYPRQ